MKYDRVEYYAGYRGKEQPLAVYIGGQRLKVKKLISLKRVREKESGLVREIFECLLENGEKIKIEKEFM